MKQMGQHYGSHGRQSHKNDIKKRQNVCRRRKKNLPHQMAADAVDSWARFGAQTAPRSAHGKPERHQGTLTKPKNLKNDRRASQKTQDTQEATQ